MLLYFVCVCVCVCVCVSVCVCFTMIFPSFLKDSFWKERFYVYDSMIPELSSSQLDQVIQK